MAEQEKSTGDTISDAENEASNTIEDAADEVIVDVKELALGDETETQPADPIADDVLEDETNPDSDDILLVAESLEPQPADTELLSVSNELDTQPADPLVANEAVSESNVVPIIATPSYSNSSTDGAKVMESTDKTSNNTSDYEIMPEASWPPPMFIKRNITPQERYYLEKRWHSQWRFFDKKANDSKKLYFRLQRIVVIGSVTVPVLVSLDPDIVAGLLNSFFTAVSLPAMTSEFARLLIDASTVVLSLAVAIAAGLESLNKYGDNWGSYRQAAEELQAEKSFYDVNGGRYTNNPDAFSRFVERTEEIIAQQNGRFVASVEKQVQESEKRGEDYISEQEDFEQGTTISEAQMTQETSYG